MLQRIPNETDTTTDTKTFADSLYVLGGRRNTLGSLTRPDHIISTMHHIGTFLSTVQTWMVIHYPSAFIVVVALGGIQALVAFVTGELAILSLPHHVRYPKKRRYKHIFVWCTIWLSVLALLLAFFNDRNQFSSDERATHLDGILQGQNSRLEELARICKDPEALRLIRELLQANQAGLEANLPSKVKALQTAPPQPKPQAPEPASTDQDMSQVLVPLFPKPKPFEPLAVPMSERNLLSIRAFRMVDDVMGLDNEAQRLRGPVTTQVFQDARAKDPETINPIIQKDAANKLKDIDAAESAAYVKEWKPVIEALRYQAQFYLTADQRKQDAEQFAMADQGAKSPDNSTPFNYYALLEYRHKKMISISQYLGDLRGWLYRQQ